MNKIKDFEAYVNSLIEKEKARLLEQMESFLTRFQSIHLETFTTERPFQGILKNMVLFTYSDHYRGNSGICMSVGKLHWPHKEYEDRGYIKGVATDLEGYLLLKAAKETFSVKESDLKNVFPYYREPKLNQSKNYEVYKNQIEAIENRYTSEILSFNHECLSSLNTFLKAYTGCSLLYYIRNL
jgi:hypothetical protein